jgi:hypothetical protein
MINVSRRPMAWLNVRGVLESKEDQNSGSRFSGNGFRDQETAIVRARSKDRTFAGANPKR